MIQMLKDIMKNSIMWVEVQGTENDTLEKEDKDSEVQLRNSQEVYSSGQKEENYSKPIFFYKIHVHT